MKTTQIFNSLDLYPSKSIESTIKIAKYNVNVAELIFPAKLMICVKQSQKKMYAKNRIVEWNSKKRSIAEFTRIDLNTKDFYCQLLTSLINKSDRSESQSNLLSYALILTFLGEDFIDKYIFKSRQYDPYDHRKKKDFKTQHISTSKINNAEILWYKHIPEAICKSLQVHKAPKQIDQDFFSEVSIFCLKQFKKDMKFSSMRDNFRYKYKYTSNEDLLIKFVEIAIHGTILIEKYLHSAALQAGDQLFSFVKTTSPQTNIDAAHRYFEFWYRKNNPISLALSDYNIATSPVRSFIHKQPYKIFDKFEKEIFVDGNTIPSLKVCQSIYDYTLRYRDWLDLSRNYKKGFR